MARRQITQWIVQGLLTRLSQGSAIALATLPLAQPLLAQPTVISPSQRPTLSLGSQGPDVTQLQGILLLLGYYTGPLSGVYGEATRDGVLRFQQAAGLAPTGQVDAAVWTRLLPPRPGAIAAAPPQPVPPQPAPPQPAQPPRSPAASTPPAAQPARPTVAPAKPVAARPTTPKPAAPPTGIQYLPEAAEILPVLSLGSEGPAVTQLQTRLQKLGLFSGAIDGDFGPATQAAVIAAQTRFQLTADGVVGPATWRAVLK